MNMPVHDSITTLTHYHQKIVLRQFVQKLKYVVILQLNLFELSRNTHERALEQKTQNSESKYRWRILFAYYPSAVGCLQSMEC